MQHNLGLFSPPHPHFAIMQIIDLVKSWFQYTDGRGQEKKKPCMVEEQEDRTQCCCFFQRAEGQSMCYLKLDIRKHPQQSAVWLKMEPFSVNGREI